MLVRFKAGNYKMTWTKAVGQDWKASIEESDHATESVVFTSPEGFEIVATSHVYLENDLEKMKAFGRLETRAVEKLETKRIIRRRPLDSVNQEALKPLLDGLDETLDAEAHYLIQVDGGHLVAVSFAGTNHIEVLDTLIDLNRPETIEEAVGDAMDYADEYYHDTYCPHWKCQEGYDNEDCDGAFAC